MHPTWLLRIVIQAKRDAVENGRDSIAQRAGRLRRQREGDYAAGRGCGRGILIVCYTWAWLPSSFFYRKTPLPFTPLNQRCSRLTLFASRRRVRVWIIASVSQLVLTIDGDKLLDACQKELPRHAEISTCYFTFLAKTFSIVDGCVDFLTERTDRQD